MNPTIIRAGKANLFLSQLFTEAFVNTTQVPVELYNCDGSVGAAIGSGIGAGVYGSFKDAFVNAKPIGLVEPGNQDALEEHYQDWLLCLNKQLNGG
jgi:xylulokinase